MYLHLFLTSILCCPVSFLNAEFLPFEDEHVPEALEETPNMLESKNDDSVDIHDHLPTDSDIKVIKIRMQDAVSPRHDGHVCSGIKLDGRDAFIRRFEPVTGEEAHHMVLVGCEEPLTDDPYWECEHSEYCKGPSTLIYVWALNGKARTLPEGVGYHIGGRTGITALVLGMHYKRKFKEGETDHSGYNLFITHHRLPHQMGFYLIGGTGYVPPMVRDYHMDMECRYRGDEVLRPIMFRTHSHNLGYVTAAYRVRRNNWRYKWTLFGKMSPQLPQSFYDIATPGMTIRSGDVLAGRCTMRSKREYVTHMGSTNKDEMCNFYIMYYKRTTDQPNEMITCFEHRRDFHLEDVYWNAPTDMSEPNGIVPFKMNKDPYQYDFE